MHRMTLLVPLVLMLLGHRAADSRHVVTVEQQRSEYRVTVAPEDGTYRRFSESTSVVVGTSRYASARSGVPVHAVGLLAWEAQFLPIDDFGDGPTAVEVRGLRRKAFVAAADIDSTPQITDYVTEQTVRWTMRSTARGISFAFIRPPLQFMRPALDPFIAASRWSDAALIALGALLGCFSIVGAFSLFKNALFKQKSGP